MPHLGVTHGRSTSDFCRGSASSGFAPVERTVTQENTRYEYYHVSCLGLVMEVPAPAVLGSDRMGCMFGCSGGEGLCRQIRGLLEVMYVWPSFTFSRARSYFALCILQLLLYRLFPMFSVQFCYFPVINARVANNSLRCVYSYRPFLFSAPLVYVVGAFLPGFCT